MTNEQERKAFEAWLGSFDPLNPNRPSTTLERNEAWRAWQARAALAATPAPPPSPDAQDAERWRTFIGLPHAIRAEWAVNLTLAPVLTSWVDSAAKDKKE